MNPLNLFFILAGLASFGWGVWRCCQPDVPDKPIPGDMYYRWMDTADNDPLFNVWVVTSVSVDGKTCIVSVRNFWPNGSPESSMASTGLKTVELKDDPFKYRTKAQSKGMMLSGYEDHSNDATGPHARTGVAGEGIRLETGHEQPQWFTDNTK